MSVYLDANVLVALFTEDALTQRAKTYLQAHSPALIVSDFAAAEFASAISRRVRTGETAIADARRAFSAFDAWTERETERVRITTTDIASATALLRRLDLKLRTGDALNIAIAMRVRADLLTFDDQMADDARTLGRQSP